MGFDRRDWDSELKEASTALDAQRPPRGPEPRIGDAPRRAADSSGYRIRPRELEYAGVSPDQFKDLQERRAPLGLSPERYEAMRAELEEALAADGLEDADVRLQGSAATFYSANPKKHFFENTDEMRDLAEARTAEGAQVNPSRVDMAVDRYEELGYTEAPKPQDKIFDQDYFATGLKKDRSDYDIQISSDTLDAKMRQLQQDDPEVTVSPKGGHWQDEHVVSKCPNLDDWSDRWTRETGRDVNLAGFPGSGPEGQCAYDENDWIIRRPTR